MPEYSSHRIEKAAFKMSEEMKELFKDVLDTFLMCVKYLLSTLIAKLAGKLVAAVPALV